MTSTDSFSQQNKAELNLDDIQNQIKTEYELALKNKHPFPANPNVVFPGKPADIPYNISLYQNLLAAQALAPNFARDVYLEKSSVDSIPVIGGLLFKIRQQLHNISLFYTNRALKHQLEINKQLIESVGQLTAVTQQQARTIQQLQKQHDPS